MISFTAVIQGPIYPETKQILAIYKEIPWIKRVILSTWSPLENSTVEQVVSTLPANPGIGNRNCQIVSSKAGVDLAEGYVIKARSDQIIWQHSMQKMYNYFVKHHACPTIFTLGMYRAFPFHPRDHMFWGWHENIKQLFDIPLDPTPLGTPADYRKVVRAETYLGQFYYMNHARGLVDKWKIRAMIEHPGVYLCDGAVLLNEALGMDYLIRDTVFKPFPPIDMAWPKHGLLSYHYDVGAAHSEYWGKDE